MRWSRFGGIGAGKIVGMHESSRHLQTPPGPVTYQLLGVPMVIRRALEAAAPDRLRPAAPFAPADVCLVDTTGELGARMASDVLLDVARTRAPVVVSLPRIDAPPLDGVDGVLDPSAPLDELVDAVVSLARDRAVSLG